MKRFVVGPVLIGLAVLTGAFDAVEAQSRLGYINSQRILVEAPGTSEVQVAFEQDMERFRAELEQLETQLDQLQENFERQQGTLSATVRQERQQEIQQRFMAYQQRRTELEEAAQQRQAELVEPIMERISQMIELIRTEGNYAMIFDASAGSLITADPGLDLTEQVLERLRSAAAAAR